MAEQDRIAPFNATKGAGETVNAKTTQMGAVVLAGGRGSRMNGVDKGLQLFQGERLVMHAVQRLQAQTRPVASIAINANRHLNDYRALGLAIWPDAQADFAGLDILFF
jgi:molybdopterin-guanine dinucleotide biosynthesis protein A